MRRRGLRALIPASLVAVALVASGFVNAVPAAAAVPVVDAADEAPASPVVVPPASARGVATSTGTEIFISPPLVTSKKDEFWPTGYQVVACGPFSIGSVQFTAALTDGCEGDPTRESFDVAADVLKVKVACTPTAVTWCAALVRSRHDELLSEPTLAGAGGVAPNAPVSVSARRVGDTVTLEWTAGRDAKQEGELPPLGTGFEIRRNGDVVAAFADEAVYIDPKCPVTLSCTYSIRTVSAAGRSAALALVLKAGDSQVSAVTPPAHVRLTAHADVAGSTVTVSGTAAPSSAGGLLQVRGLSNDTSAEGVDVPVNLAGGWSYVVARDAMGSHRLTVVESTPGRLDRSVVVNYNVRTLRAVAAAKAPGAPLKVTAVLTGTQVQVAWQTPANNGSPITKYVVTGAPGGGTCTYVVPKKGAAANSCVIKNLAYGTAYKFGVKAYNSVGASAVANSAAVTPKAAPAAPTKPTVAQAVGGLAVSWTAPAANGSPITSYKATATPGGGSCTYTVPRTPANTCTINGLTPGTSYTVKVVAKNAVDWSVASPASLPVTVPTLPGAPTIVTVQSMDGAATVSWTPPVSNGGSPIIRYTATVVGDANKSCTYTVPLSGPSENFCRVGSLANGSKYKFTVTAINGVGTSPASAESTAIYAGATAAVSSVTATAGNGSATVTVPNFETLPTTMDYAVYLVTVDGQSGLSGCTAYREFVYSPVFAAAPTASCTVYGLTNGVEYTFTVRVKSTSFVLPDPDIAAFSPPTRSNPVTPAAPPGAPQTVTVYSYNGGALLSWEAPGNNGGSPITAYRVTATPPSGDPITYSYGPSARRVNISGLENGTRYSMSVTTVTERGTGSAVASSSAFFTARTSAPRSIAVVGGDTQATVTWEEPTSVPFPVLSYTITATDYFYPDRQVTFVASGSPATFTGLTNGRTYTFAVVAENDAGPSPASAASAATLVATLPEAPSSASVESGNRFVTVTWAPVDYEHSGGSTVSEYVITATPAAGAVITKTVTGSYTQDWSSLESAVTALDGLLDGVDYTFTVAAKNSMGVSPVTSAGTTHSIGAASRVVITSAVGANGRVTVTWSAPTSDGGSAVTRYNVSASYRSCSVVPSGPGPYSCTVSGLSNGSTYGFMVETQNGAGSSYSDTYFASPGISAPDSPSSVTALASTVTQGAVAVSWQLPNDNGGSSITSYTVTANPGSRTCSAYLSDATTCTVYGLTAGASYTFTATATNGLGTSPASSASAPTMALGRPGQPAAPIVRGGPSTATVSFSAPPANGLPITRYEVSVIDMGPYDNPPAVYGTESPITVTGLILGHTYRFAVTARNSFGTVFAPGDSYMSPMSADWISANKPSAPSITSVTPGTDSVYVAFTTPANGGSPITSYELVAIDDTESVADTIVQVASSPGEITGLVTGHTYRVTVRATNVAGDSPASIVSASVVPQAAPGAPSGVTSESTDGGLSVSFTAPADSGGSAVTGYRVRAHDSVTGADTYATGANSPIAIGSLVNGRAYSVSVQATKSAYIAGPFANGAESGTPAGLPGAPTNVVAANSQNAQSSVSFTAPNGNGAAITSYTVTATDQVAPFAVVTATGSTSPIVITGLTNRHTYRVTVAATNRMGTGTATPNVGFTIPVAPPGAPTIGVVSATGATSASVEFIAPGDNGGSPVISYTVTATDTDAAAGSRVVVGYGSPIAVTGLVAGDTYSFTVTATNASATGSPSSAVPVAPQAVSELATTAGSTQAEIRWTIPSALFGEPARYTAVTGSGESCTSSGASCVITGLTNYETYSVTVSASNASGTSASTAPVSVTPVPVSVATSVASAPRNVVATPQINGFGDGTATVTWEMPADSGGGAITGYTVTTSPADATCFTQYLLACVLTGLDPYALYTVRVVANNSLGSSIAGVSSEVSACGFDSRLTRCKWKAAGQDVRAEQVDGGVRVSWSYGTGRTATAMPSGLTCTSIDFDPVTLAIAPVDAQGRHYCVIAGSFDRDETFRVALSEFDSSSAVHATWVSAVVPAYTQAATPRITGTLTSGASVSVIAAPVSCLDPLNCPNSLTFTGNVTAGAFDIPLTLIDEGAYRVYVTNPQLLRVLARTTPQTMVVDRTNPTPLTVPAGTSVTAVDNVSAAVLGVDFEKTAIVTGLAECDSVNTFTVAWFAGGTATGSALRVTSPVRSPLGSVCWYTDTLPAAADGTYTVVVTLDDPSGNSSTVSENVVVDSVAPNLLVDVPLVGETVPAGIIGVSGTSVTVAADMSDLSVSAVRGAEVIARSVTVGVDNSWSTELALSAGSWVLTVERIDRAGNSTVLTRAITVVDSPTTLSIAQPTADSVVSATTTVRGWAIPGSRVVLTAGDSDLATTTAASDGSWSARVSLGPSATTLSASVGAVRATVPISVGTPGSAVTIANPGVGGRTNGRPITGTGPAGATVTVTIDSTATDVVVDADGQWSVPLTGYSGGNHTVSASDTTTTSTLTIVIDRSAPSVSITAPGATTVRESSVVVATTSVISDAASVQMSFYLGTDTLDDPEFVTDVPVTGATVLSAFPSALADGLWTLIASRSDAAGNVGRAQVTFTYDRQAPVVNSNIASSMTGPLTITGVAGTASGDHSLTISIDGQDWIPPMDGAFSYTPSPAITSGAHAVVLRQVDDAGNETVRSLTVTVDSIAPNLTMVLDGTGATFAGLTITGSATGDDGQVDIAATGCSVEDSPCAPDVTTQKVIVDPAVGAYAESMTLTGGYWYVTARRVDAAGNTTTRSALVLVDIAAPELTMVSPLETVASGVLTVSGLTPSESWRNPQVHLAVTRVGAGSATYEADASVVDSAYTVTTPLIADGVYDVVVTRADPVHPASVTRRVTIDTSGPQLVLDAVPDTAVRIYCVSAGTSARDLTTVSFRLALTAASYAYVQQVTVSAGRACVTPASEGTWSISVAQSDSLGNETLTATVPVSFDFAAPTVFVNEPSFTNQVPGRWAAAITGTAGTATEDTPLVRLLISRQNCTLDCTRELLADVNADGTWAVDLAGVPAGSWRVTTATQADAAGNVGTFRSSDYYSLTYSFAVDHTAPSAPTLTGSGASGGISLQACTGSGIVPFTITVNVYRSGVTEPFRSTSWLTSDYWCSGARYILIQNWLIGTDRFPNGNYTVVAEMSDPLGRVARSSSLPYASNWVTPRVAIGQISAGDNPTGVSSGAFGQALTVSGTGSYNDFDPRTVTLTFDALSGDQSYRDSLSSSTFVATLPLAADGTWSTSLPANLPVGSYRVTAVQGAGRATTSFAVTVPAPVVVSATVSVSSSNSQTITVSGTMPVATTTPSNIVGTDLTITAYPQRMGDSVAKTCSPVVAGNTWTCTLTGAYPNGSYTFTAATRLSVAYTKCTAISNSGVCTTQGGVGTQRVSGSGTFTLNGEVPEPYAYFDMQPSGGWSTYSSTALQLTGGVSNRPSDLMAVTIRIYRRSDIANWPTIVENPHSTFTTNALAFTGRWSKEIYVPEGRWVVQVSQSNQSGLVGYSTPREFTVDTSPPDITISYPSPQGIIPSGRLTGTITGGFGTSAGLNDRSNLSYAQDGRVTYYKGWNGTAGVQGGFEWISTNRNRTWEARSNNVFTSSVTLTAGKWTAVVEANDENGRQATRSIEFEVNPSLLPARPTITARLDGTTPITGMVNTDAGYHRITVRVEEKYGWGLSQAPKDGVRLKVGNVTYEGWLVNREATFLVLLVAGDNALAVGFDGSPDNLAVDVRFNWLSGYLRADARPAQNLSATFSYAAGAGAPGVATVAASYIGVDSAGRTGTLPCLGSIATVVDSAGKVLGSGSLANGGRFAIAATASGSQDLTVRVAEGSECGSATGAFPVTLAATPTPTVTATVASTPMPFVGGDAVINANVSVSSLTPLVVGVPVHVENAGGTIVSTATVLTDASGNAVVRVSPTVAGNNSLTVVAGGDRSGFQRTTAPVTVPVEPAAISMSVTVDSAGTRAGDAALATLIVGGPGTSGTVTLASGRTPGPDAETLRPVLVCSTDCRVTSRFPVDVRDAGPDGTLLATFTSASTGRVFTKTVATGQVAWTATLSDPVIGAGPPISLTAVSGGSGRVNLAWIAPRTVGSTTVTGYQVNATIGGLSVGECTTASTSCTISGLANDTAILFSAVTRTSAGDSGFVTATAAASPLVSQTPVPVSPTELLSDTVLRDRLAPVSTKVLFPSAMAEKFRTGTVTFHAEQRVYCGQTGVGGSRVITYCTPTRHDVTVDLATGVTTDTLVISNVNRSAIPAESLAAAGLTIEMLTPRSTVNIAVEPGGIAVTVTSQVFVGAYLTEVTADYSPGSSTAVASARSARAAAATGAGAPVIRIAIASANITGGKYAPTNLSSRREGAETVLSWSNWGVRDPRVGETAFVRATIDPVFGVDDDAYAPLALAVSQPGVQPLFASPDSFSPNDRLYSAADMYGTERVTINVASTPFGGQEQWRRAVAGTGLTCPIRCIVWALRNVESADPVDAGALNVGTNDIGVMSYSPSGHGIASTTLNVDPWVTTQMTEAALTSETTGQKIRVMTAARWTGMAPEVQTSMANVMVSVQLTHSGVSQVIAICFYSGVCLSSDGNGTTFLKPDITPIGGRMAMEIDPASLGYTLTRADTIIVTTTTPWGIPAVSSSLALNPTAIAVGTTGAAAISTTGQWLGGVLQEPSPIHNEVWWAANSALSWFRDAQHSLWMSIFRSEAVASFLMTVTAVGLSFIPLWNIFTAMTCSTWSCAAFAMASVVAGPLFSGLKAGFNAFKALRAASAVARPASAAASAPGRVAKFLSAVKSRAAASATRVSTSVPAQVARQMVWAAQFRVSQLNRAWLFFGKLASQTAQAEIIKTVLPGRESFDEIVAGYMGVSQPDFPQSRPANDPAFREVPDFTLLTGDQMLAVDESTQGQQVAAWDQAVADAYAAVAAANPAQPIDVGYGPGVSMQFAQQFSSQISIALPNLAGVNLNASKVQAFIMDSSYDAASDNFYHSRNPAALEATGLAALGTCTFAGSCATLDGITATVFRGSLQISGLFPQSVSWFPRGAWIKYLVTVVSNSGVTTLYRANSNISFPGRVATDVEAGSSGAITMAYVRPYGTDPVGPYIPWPTGEFDPKSQYSVDTATLTGAL